MIFYRVMLLSLLAGMASACQSAPSDTMLAPHAVSTGLMPLPEVHTTHCGDYTGLPPLTDGTCSQMHRQVLNTQLHNMAPRERQHYLLEHVNTGLPGRLLWGLAYTQPSTGTAMRQIGQQTLTQLQGDIPPALQPFLRHHIAMNQTLLDAAAAAKGYRQANQMLHNDIIELHLTVQEKVQQIEALTDIESRLSTQPLLETGTHTLNNAEEPAIDE